MRLTAGRTGANRRRGPECWKGSEIPTRPADEEPWDYIVKDPKDIVIMSHTDRQINRTHLAPRLAIGEGNATSSFSHNPAQVCKPPLVRTPSFHQRFATFPSKLINSSCGDYSKPKISPALIPSSRLRAGVL